MRKTVKRPTYCVTNGAFVSSFQICTPYRYTLKDNGGELKIARNEIDGLLLRRPVARTLQPQDGRHKSGRLVAVENERDFLVCVSQFGHLRIAELARAIWPSGRCAEQMAQRTASRLVRAGLLAVRKNALATRSFVLTRRGAAFLEVRGIPARHTLELSSVSGATFIHRSLASRYLIEKQLDGKKVAGEYRLSNGDVPFQLARLEQAAKKHPDGVTWSAIGGSQIGVDWIEVENAAKPLVAISSILRVAELIGASIDSEIGAVLRSLVIVFDGDQNHGRRICKAANERWGNLPVNVRERYERSIFVCRASMTFPLHWRGMSEISLHDLRRASQAKK